MKRLWTLVLLGCVVGLTLPLPVLAQRGSPSRSEPARNTPEPPRGPSFVAPALMGAACTIVLVVVVCLPGRRTQQRS